MSDFKSISLQVSNSNLIAYFQAVWTKSKQARKRIITLNNYINTDIFFLFGTLQCSKLDEMEREFNTTISPSQITIDDIRYTRSQVEHLLANRDQSRLKRATWDFSHYPYYKWTTMPIKYVINPQTYTSKFML